MASFAICNSTKNLGSRPGFEILSFTSIKEYQEEAVDKISDVLLICKDDAFHLLKRHGWCGDKLFDSWFDDENQPPPPPPVIQNDHLSEFYCSICLDLQSSVDSVTLLCGHRFCITCVKGWVSNALEGGTVLELVCPLEGCSRAVGPSLVESVCSTLQGRKYKKIQVMSYVDHNPRSKWCPFPDCSFAVALEKPKMMDVECYNLHNFCWQCSGEAHEPLVCSEAETWLRFSQNLKTINWRAINVNNCPRCQKPIHHDGGCMHMTCACKYEFCWICLEKWELDHFCDATHEKSSQPQPDLDLDPEQPFSEKEFYYKRLFIRRGREFEEVIQESQQQKGISVVKSMAWFEIRKCMSQLKWSCASACSYKLDIVKFVRIQEESERQLDALLDSVKAEVEGPIEYTRRKTRKAFNAMLEMLEMLNWETGWSEAADETGWSKAADAKDQ